MNQIKKNRQRHMLCTAICIILMILSINVFGVAVSVPAAQESEQTQKHLVIKVIEDEELVDIEDYDVPLSSFSEGNEERSSGIRHIILMSAMLACVIVYVFYQGINEKKIINLRKHAARAQYQVMTENRKS